LHEDILGFSEIRARSHARSLACVSIVHTYMHLPEQYVHSIHTALVHWRSYLLSPNVESSQQAVGSLLSEYLYPRTWMSAACADTHTVARIHTNARYKCRRYLSSLLYCNRCLLLRAARATLSRFRLLRFSNFCLPLLASLPSPFVVVPSLLTEKRFSPFLPRDRTLTLSPTRLGGGKHEAQQRQRGGRFLPLSFFPLSFSLPPSSLFSLRKTILSNQRSDNNRDLGINGTNRWLIDCVVYAWAILTALCRRFERR